MIGRGLVRGITHVKISKGMRDYYGQKLVRIKHIEDRCRELARIYGCQEVRTPALEQKSLFHRSLGEDSEIVQKEMYHIEGNKEDHYILRPEGTTPIVRAALTGHWHSKGDLPMRCYYSLPMFRKEKPQKGRYREFHQFGIELLQQGAVLADVEALLMADTLIRKDLQLGPNQVKLHVNSIGGVNCRARYKEALTTYLQEFSHQLSPESASRLKKGDVLRILDSKHEKDQKVIENAPHILDSLSERHRERWVDLQGWLVQYSIPFKYNHTLVRGLDYYNDFVFEYRANHPALGSSQSTVLAGGRYDKLFTKMGGPSSPCVGWAAGLERLEMIMNPFIGPSFVSWPRVAVVPLGTEPHHAQTLEKAMHTVYHVRANALPVVYFAHEVKKNPSTHLKRAVDRGANVAVFIGTKELNEDTLSVKDLETGVQTTMNITEFITMLKNKKLRSLH